MASSLSRSFGVATSVVNNMGTSHTGPFHPLLICPEAAPTRVAEDGVWPR